MKLGMNLTYLDNYWNGMKEKNFADFVKPDEAAKREKMFADIARAGFKTVRIPINFGVWATSGMYPRDLGGLGASYVAAIPFFHNSLAGDLIFCALLFGGWALAERTVPSLREARPAFA